MLPKKIIKIFFFSYVLFSQTTCIDTSFWLPQHSSFRFHNNIPIKIKEGSFDKLITRWQNKLAKSWNNFLLNLQADIGVSPKQLQAYLEDENLANIYSSLKEKDFLQAYKCIPAEDADPAVLNFITRFIQKYCSKKNIKILLSSHINTITATFGSDNHTHYLICHANIYSPENINYYYECLGDANGAFYIEPSSTNKIRSIELANFLQVGLIEAASHIQHQSNLLTFLISNIKVSNIRPSESTIQSCWHITETRSIIEAILQSKNPLESALFIGKTKKKTEKEKALWKKLVYEIADCYEPESLDFFKESIQEINSLYTQK